MTSVHTFIQADQQHALEAALLLQWTALVNCRCDDPDAQRSNPRARHQQMTASLAVCARHDRASIEAWMDQPGQARTQVLPCCIRPCTMVFDGSMIHLDIVDDVDRLLSLTVDQQCGLLYARSTVPGLVAAAAGLFGPPALARFTCSGPRAAAVQL